MRYKMDNNIQSTINSQLSTAKEASIDLALLDNETINQVLQAVADRAIAETDIILSANAKDLARMDETNPMYDRLKLTKERIEGIANDTRKVSTLPSPLGRVLKQASERSIWRDRYRL